MKQPGNKRKERGQTRKKKKKKNANGLKLRFLWCRSNTSRDISKIVAKERKEQKKKKKRKTHNKTTMRLQSNIKDQKKEKNKREKTENTTKQNNSEVTVGRAHRVLFHLLALARQSSKLQLHCKLANQRLTCANQKSP